ncbi:MAG: VWA domain-containing protein [Pyrinomonadaceae bacterium]
MKILFNRSLAIIFILIAAAVSGFGQNAPIQTPKPAPTPPVEEDSDVVKISTALIQLDVVVTDKNGKPITDLKPEDFEVSENGERQTITGLSYFSGQKNAPASGSLNANSAGAMPVSGEVRRTVAIVVDDAGISNQSINLVRKELAKFVSEQVQPGDLVAIIKTSGSVGILQQFTTDKEKLLATIDNLHYQPLTSSGLSPFEPISVTFAEQILANTTGEFTQQAKSVTEQKNNVESLAEINRNLTVTSGSLGVLNATINAMSGLPGRKSVLYVAEGVYSLFAARLAENNQGGTSSIFKDTRKLEEDLRGITETANRATIAIYALDPRGTLPVNFSAADQMRGGMTERELQAAEERQGRSNTGRNDRDLTDRADQLKASQLGLKFLSEETSGKAFINTNDLGKSLRETLDSQNGYYILAYQPDAETFDPNKRRFNKLTVKVKRPNVNVSYRSGFFNVAESENKKEETPDRAFLQKIFSPYKATDVGLRMTSVYAADEQTSTIRSFVNINTKDLQFVEGADKNKTVRFDVLAVAFNENGVPIAQVGKVFEVKASPERYLQLLKEGINYNLTFTTKTRGAEQIKVSVRDQNTQRVGTALQTVVIPNFDKQPLGLSGILLADYTAQEFQNMQNGKAPADTATRMQANTASRQFKEGTVLSFSYAVYAAPSLRTKSQAQFTVFKDGKEVFKGAAEDLNITPNGKIQRINRGGAFLLGTDMAAGRYVLQVAVAGDALKEPQVQQIDFELVN